MSMLFKALTGVTLAIVVGCVGLILTAICAPGSGLNVAINGQPAHGVSRFIIGSVGLIAAIIAAIIGIGAAVLAVAGAGIAVFFALLLCALILLCVALPFLIPVALVFGVLMVFFYLGRLTSRRKS